MRDTGHGVPDADKALVFQRFGRSVVPEDDALRVEEVPDRRALLEEFGIADDVDRMRSVGHELLHTFVRADRHRALQD